MNNLQSYYKNLEGLDEINADTITTDSLNGISKTTLSYLDATSSIQNQINNISLTVGPQGPQGIQGVKGDTGLQGIQGVKGDTGLQGIQGVKGDTGLQGIQGVKGDTGLQGICKGYKGYKE